MYGNHLGPLLLVGWAARGPWGGLLCAAESSGEDLANRRAPRKSEAKKRRKNFEQLLATVAVAAVLVSGRRHF